MNNFCIVSNFGLFLGNIENDDIVPFFRIASLKQKVLVPSDFFGITWNKECIFLSRFDSIICIDQNNEIKIYKDKTWADLHQIYCLEDKLYVCNTSLGTIEILQIVGENLKKTGIKKIENVAHLNSIYFKDDYFYLCDHNKQNPSYILKCNKNFDIIDKYENIGFENHNICIMDDFLYTLSSKKGELVKINLTDKKKEKINISFNDKSYAKGLAYNNKYFLIGLNQQEPDRDKRTYKSCIVIYDNNLEFVKQIELPELHQIKSIKFFKNGLCHNGLDFPINLHKLGTFRQVYMEQIE